MSSVLQDARKRPAVPRFVERFASVLQVLIATNGAWTCQTSASVLQRALYWLTVPGVVKSGLLPFLVGRFFLSFR